MHPKLCRDCFYIFQNNFRCPNCHSPRIIAHEELFNLSVAHIDCDAFYASIEKRENPNIKHLPVIVGGQHRGVVTTCCYIARINGVKSAMPIFQAKKLCPNAVIVPPRISYYRRVSNAIKERLKSLSPAIEFVSLDEAYIDLSGTERVHGEAPAVKLAKIAKNIEEELKITISIGLSYNKFLSKISSELDKPRGFYVIGQADTEAVLKHKPIDKILGVGKKTKVILQTNGINEINDLLKYSKADLKNMLGSFGKTLWFLARGIDNRKITPNKPTKSISCEKTFQNDQFENDILIKYLWELTEQISSRLKNLSLVAGRLQLKLKRANFKSVVNSSTLKQPSNSSEIIFQVCKILLQKNTSKGPFRLIGISLTELSSSKSNIWNSNFFQNPNAPILAAENAVDQIRSKFGKSAIIKGRSLKAQK